MAYLISNLKADIKADVWPNGVPENLEGQIDNFVVSAMMELQRFIPCMELMQVDIVPFCATYFQCGLSVSEAPRGVIRRVATIEEDGYCNPCTYRHSNLFDLQRWSRDFVNRIQTLPANLGLAALPLGFKFPEDVTDATWGRAVSGRWTIDRKRLIVAPWLQSNESLLIEWSGRRFTWVDTDQVSVGKESDLVRAVKLYVQKEFARDFDCDMAKMQVYERDWLDARGDLIWQCQEETKERKAQIIPEESGILWRDKIAAAEDTDTEEPVVFAIIGDYGLDGIPESEVAALVKSWDPAFVVTAGDNNYQNGAADTIDANIGQYYRKFIYPYAGSQPLASGEEDATENKFWPVLGNHDWDTTDAQPYLDYFTLPNNERYYEKQIGEVHLFMLDSGYNTLGALTEIDGNTQGSIQGAWLNIVMMRSTARWKIVVLHHPPYTDTETYTPGYTALRWPFGEWGADVVISGHGHAYERFVDQDIPYVVCGTGGGVLVGFATVASGGKINLAGLYGALKASATCSELKIEFIDTSGVVGDTLTISK